MGWLASFHPSDDPRHAHHPTILQATLLQKGQEARVQQPVETVTLGLAFCMASKKANAYMQAAHAPDESSSFLSACLIRCSLSAFLSAFPPSRSRMPSSCCRKLACLKEVKLLFAWHLGSHHGPYAIPVISATTLQITLRQWRSALSEN